MFAEAGLFLQLGLFVGIADVAGAVLLCTMREAEGVEQFVDGDFIEKGLVLYPEGRDHGALSRTVAEAQDAEILFLL